MKICGLIDTPAEAKEINFIAKMAIVSIHMKELGKKA